MNKNNYIIKRPLYTKTRGINPYIEVKRKYILHDFFNIYIKELKKYIKIDSKNVNSQKQIFFFICYANGKNKKDPVLFDSVSSKILLKIIGFERNVKNISVNNFVRLMNK